MEPPAASLRTPLARAVFAIGPRGGKLSPDLARTLPLLELAIGDVTLEATDAVVNPTGGGQVDQAVRRTAGSALDAALRESIAELLPPRLMPGQVVVTSGFALRTKHVLHCAPPVYADDPVRARTELEACHVEALRVARRLGLTSLSIPAIATGAYRFPMPEAAVIATRVVIEALRGQAALRLVRFVLNGPATLDVYADAARRHLALR
jgi:O-acetyl-ADP-ribose deacetylase (regulator of RNase III)